MTCTRCENTGFLNLFQIDQETIANWEATGDNNIILEWIKTHTEPHDVSVCDCCGNGEMWYGEPGEHFMGGDHAGREGPYGYNGGLPECN